MHTLDIIIPVYNEAPVLKELARQLDAVFHPDALKKVGLKSVRYLFVDDGSADETASILADKIHQGWHASLICLSRNFGHQAALVAGLDHATADFVGIIDADLQDPPETLLEMLDSMKNGYDVVYGQRRSRQEPFYLRVLYAAFYRLCSFLSEVHFPVDVGDFCVMRQEVVMALHKLPEKLRFIRGLRSWVGFRQHCVPYDRPARHLGTSKYTLHKLYALATDGIASLSVRPLRVTQLLLFLSILGTLAFVGTAVYLYVRQSMSTPYMVWFLATQGLIAFTASLQLLSFYILGGYIGRMYLEVKARPTYVVMRTIGIPSDK